MRVGTRWPDNISPREAEVLAALGEYRSNAQIAHRLHISVRTVESHVSSLLRKLGVADRRALAAFAGPHHPGQSVPLGEFVGLPVGRTTFVGRERDRSAVITALAGGRLVTLLGPGGVGKTRLAAVVAASVATAFPAGGAFVDLLPIRAGSVAQALASALGVTEQPPQPLEHTIAARLGLRRTLLVLDNCEHLVDDISALIGLILDRCPHTAVIATSRRRLGVPGERSVRVAPLPVEPDGVRLFYDRARAVDANLALDPSQVADLCTRLDGIPLAIELAAARAASLGMQGMLAAVEDRLRLLAGGRGPDHRHGSLRAVMRWSYDLLDDDERSMLRLLSVFVGSFDLAAAANVADRSSSEAADLIGRLVDHSLVVRDSRSNRSRWRLLDTVRAFAADELTAAGLRDEAHRRHLGWAAATAEELDGRLNQDWAPAFDTVVDDLRAALSATGPVPEPTAYRLARCLAHLTFARGFFLEARQLYLAAADRAGDAAQAGNVLNDAADAALAVYDGPAAFSMLVEAANRLCPDGHPNAAAAALACAIIIAVRYPGEFTTHITREHRAALLETATTHADPEDPHTTALIAAARAWHEGRHDAVDEILARAAVDAARKARDPIWIAGALDALGQAAATTGRMREANRIAAERLTLLANLPRDVPRAAVEITDAFHVATACAVAAGDLPAARAILRRATTEDPLGGHPYLTVPRLVRVLVLTGDFDEAIRRADDMWEEWRRDGAPTRRWMSSAVAAAALPHGVRGDGQFELWRTRALEVAGCADPIQSPGLAACMTFVDARLAVHTGDLAAADVAIDTAFAAFTQPWWVAYARAAAAELAVVAGRPDAEQFIELAAPHAAENAWAAACLARARGRIAGDRSHLHTSVEGWERVEARFERACTLLLLADRADEARTELDALGCILPDQAHRSRPHR